MAGDRRAPTPVSWALARSVAKKWREIQRRPAASSAGFRKSTQGRALTRQDGARCQRMIQFSNKPEKFLSTDFRDLADAFGIAA
ncbi:MAG TPA: hypothetical protein VHM31_10795 [Polyangia bacterium]|nr:hypothetical protein [Polyangia bacterium]